MASLFLWLNVSGFVYFFCIYPDILGRITGEEVCLNSFSKEEMDVVYLWVLFVKFGKFSQHIVLIGNVPAAFHRSSITFLLVLVKSLSFCSVFCYLLIITPV